jgi:adenosylcobyric acid synthase
LLPVSTTFASPKTSVRVRARVTGDGPLAAAAGADVHGYEIHAGVSITRGGRAALTIVERGGAPADAADGVVAGTVVGTYVHGLLTCAPLRRALLLAAARRRGVDPDPRWGTIGGGDRYDRLADLVGAALDLDAIATLARRPLSAVAS